MDPYLFGRMLAIVAVVVGLVALALRPMPASQRWMWVAVIVLLPLIGTVLFFVLAKSTSRAR